MLISVLQLVGAVVQQVVHVGTEKRKERERSGQDGAGPVLTEQYSVFL